MSDDAKAPASGRTAGAAETGTRSTSEAELALLAIEEAFIAEHRAGRAPRLSAYIQAYPEHAAALTTFVARFLSAPEPVAVEDSASAPLSAGTRRALARLFPPAADEAATTPAAPSPIPHALASPTPDSVLPLVAETPARYVAPPTGLLTLAGMRGMSPEALAATVDLSSSIITWLDRAALPPGEAPHALVERLAAALGCAEDEVQAALAATGTGSRAAVNVREASSAATFRAVIATDSALTPQQRRRWLALLEGR